MALVKKSAAAERWSFSKIKEVISIPNLIEIQRRSFDQFLQMKVPPHAREEIGLQGAFAGIFPIFNYDNSASLDFVKYEFGVPKYGAEESLEKGMTYSVPLKVTLRLMVWERPVGSEAGSIRDIKEQEVYLGEMPLMTPQGTFIINGTERVVVSQLHRSPGVFFDHDSGKTHPSGKTLYSARLIPYRGSWLEFEFDANDVLHVRVDRRRRFLVSILLRAIGYGSNEEILNLFYERDVLRVEKGKEILLHVGSTGATSFRVSRDIPDPHTKQLVLGATKRITKAAQKRLQALKIAEVSLYREDLIGRIAAADIVDTKSGEVVLECAQEITEETLEKILNGGVTSFAVLASVDGRDTFEIRESIIRDSTRSEKDALTEMYRRMRPGDPPNEEATKAFLESIFFNPKRYDLSRVGRLKINRKLGLDVPLEVHALMCRRYRPSGMEERIGQVDDIVEAVRYLLRLKHGEAGTSVDDIDHLGNRRVRSAGELLEEQFRIGLARMERAVRERMSTQELETLMPHDLVNAKPVTAALKEFFGSSQLSQFMDQTNPLAELTHKRRLSALGPGGLSRERAGFEVRDVHPTHYGRMCPIETPEGPNVGLIASLSTYARVNDFGFIETPYRKVRDGFVTDEIEYLTADEEEKYTIAQANAELDGRGRFTSDRISARTGGNFVTTPPANVDYMDVAPKQLVGVSTSLVPFLEHDDANRALMGANMQRQAVPLLRPEAPIVGTGMEHPAARDSGTVLVARRGGIVESVTADRIIVRTSDSRGEDGEEDTGVDIYTLVKFRRSNQNTCLTQKPIVGKGERIVKGRVIADGPATQNGELALGQNVMVAFMPWGGYNFEDAILISERLVKDDRYTSIHIEEFEIEARETKLGKEEITRDTPNVGEDALKDLDESGIVRIGAEVKPGDILVGKVTPKGETVLTPEERLLRAIFGEKAEDVRDASLYVPPGICGTVVDVKVFSRKGVEKDERAKSIEDEEVSRLRKDFEDEIGIIAADRDRKLRSLLEGKDVGKEIRSRLTRKIVAPKGKKLTDEILDKLSHEELVDLAGRLDDDLGRKASRISDAADNQVHVLQTLLEERINRATRGDELAPGVFKMVKVYVAMKRKLSVGDKMAGRHGNKGVIAKVLPEEDMPYLPDGTPVEVVLNPLGVPSRMNVGQILETHLGWAAGALGLRVASPVFDGAKEQEIKTWLKRAGLPASGKTVLCDGRTGKPFHQEVTVGYIYLMKLAHLVDDKIHARSIGPYSLITQQPLGGKAQFGGQRFGEMEVWALEAYGAAYTLQEILTVKSDDVVGRTKMYESIVRGDCTLDPGLPESFNVLVKELQSLALDVELKKE
ncbi:DNA-directed RNA polymerase subunit beta [Candidatus Methylomirabilis lanthanidiphila]|uniref:DNA-directed RNA polymerase subunit beta n=1 Tax=Candidatus Methylomirabilis lanthanidiphila TaxID=2211376 RepID=A0A564ZMJ9_9BACT|nr:DNA-directed RNA polymerase subunit beta [Candidatus Methylomirabilis lanthanidiphila]VUZ86560.1 DNA-directed RNA polymerase subunit beta [Candidatus Methylomirabilis lanthanidiphila]